MANSLKKCSKCNNPAYYHKGKPDALCQYHYWQTKRTPLKRSTKPIKSKPVKKISDKQKEVLAELQVIYDDMAKDIDNMFCINCETTRNLTHSHIIPISFNKGEFHTNRANIYWMCSECHAIHERHSIDAWIKRGQKNIHKIMDIIKGLSEEYYNKRINKSELWKQ